MSQVLWLLVVQAVLGAFDTLYYHEWRARLPARPEARPELLLHAARDLVYGVLFASLPWIEWQGVWAFLLLGLLAVEIAITLADFVIEDRVRRPQGGVFPGERATHAVMGIVYGATLSRLLPEMWTWAALPTALVLVPAPVPALLRWLLTLFGAGVVVAGLRDLLAAQKGLRWPWAAIVP